MTSSVQRTFLNVGSGRKCQPFLPAWLATPQWRQVQLDIEPRVEPDIVCSATDMRGHVANDQFDALWAANIVEHLYAHEVKRALREFARVVKAAGVIYIWVPNLQKVAEHVVAGNLDGIAYQSAVGPIAPIDVLFGHRAYIEKGATHMAHKTGFIASTLGSALADAGIPNWVILDEGWDLLAIASRTPLENVAVPPDLMQKMATGLSRPPPDAAQQCPG